MDNVINYFKGDALAAEVWLNKYAAEGELTPDDMHKRMAKEYTRIERKYLNKREETFGMVVDNLSEYGKERFSNLYMSGFHEDYYYNLIKNFEYIIPGGSIMANLGLNTPTSLSNCFVLGQPDDTIESIFNYARDAAQLYKRRGGVGMDLSLLRPRFSKVNNASSTSTGSVSFAELYSKTTSLIGQDGRRGALMLSLDVRHPDILDFIKCKEDLTKINSANISVKVNAEFMKAVLDNTDYTLRFPCDSLVTVDLAAIPENETFESFYKHDVLYKDIKGVYFKKIKARELWEELIKHAHGSAEPGILFWDNHLDMDPSAVYPKHKPISTNPCGEIPLPPKDSCRLSAANLYSLVSNAFRPTAHINEDTVYAVFYEQLVISDNLIDLETEAIDRILAKINPSYVWKDIYEWPKDYLNTFISQQPEEFKLWWEVREMGLSSRRVGNGFTALGDMFAALGFKYGDKQSKDAIERVMYLKEKAELDATIDLALMRGKFKDFDKKKEDSPYFYRLSQVHPRQYERMCKFGRRNISWSTVAPTGTVSLMARTTSGIEPLFMPYYTRRVKDEDGSYLGADGNLYKEYLVVHPKLQEWFIQCGGKIEDDFDIITWQTLYESSPYYNSCANDIAWQDRLEIQAIIQQFTTHSISSTLNLHANTTIEEVNEIYLEAYRLGLKGITIYRDGCRDGVLVDSSAKSTTSSSFEEFSAPKRPKQLSAHLHHRRVKGVSYIVAVGLMDDKPYEIFCQQNKEEFDYSRFEEGIIYKIKKGIYEYQSFDSEGNLVLRLPLQENTIEERTNALFLSMLLRHRAPVSEVIKVAKKIDDNISSFISAICRVLSRYVAKTEVKGEVCPDCGSKLQHEAGCVKCTNCTYSKCLFIYSPIRYED